jgi:hypothetical protein
MTKLNWLKTLKNAVSELEVEHMKFYEKGNNSAGTRARKILQDIKTVCNEGRIDIQTSKKADVK